MRNLLWKYYLEDDVDKFRRLLENAGQNLQYPAKSHTGATGPPNSFGVVAGSPGGFATPPRTVAKSRKVSGPAGTSGGIRGANTPVSRAELNSRDHAGLTILHRAASSTSSNSISFAFALIEHPAIDLYIQDTENGWTALHRALYFGNITIARAIIARDRADPNGPGGTTSTRAGSSVIKVKDYEGNSPFDVYNATIARRSPQQVTELARSEDGSQDDAESVSGRPGPNASLADDLAIGDELFVFGSNKNHSLGFGDGDDRQHPEKISLKRPDHLLFRFYREYLELIEDSSDLSQSGVLKPMPKSLNELPTLILNRPVIVQDVTLSKLHSAILTTDPEANLYMCGFGPGGRLGTGDEVTRSTFVCIEEGGLAGKKVMTVALGQNHTLAVSSKGEVFSWGTSTYGQLGYSLPRPTARDEEPVCATPRQIFGPLKRETIIGVAASAIHSVAHTSSSLFCWGKNEGQLGLMDSDSRSLAVQPVPRKVGASLFKAAIQMISAINGATICLLANRTVCVFTNYGYNIVKFPLHAEFSNYHLRSAALTTRYEATSNHISSVTAGGDTIAAISSRGDLFTFNVRKIDSDIPSASTTNPSKIKSALSPPQRIWSLRKGHWDGIRSVGVSENGSVIICTQAGAVWRRVNRTKAKDAFTGAGGLSRKDYKFQRVPGLTKVTAVRSNIFGVYAAIRRDCDVTKSQISIDEQNLWQDIQPLLSIRDVVASDSLQYPDSQANKTSALLEGLSSPMKRAVLTSPSLEADVSRHLYSQDLRSYDFEIRSSVSEVGIPVHGFVLAARSSILRSALAEFRLTNSASVSDLFVIEESSSISLPRPCVVFQGLDFITIVNLAIYLYTDEVVDVWHFTRQAPKMAFRYRQIRAELMKTAGHLKMGKLESAVRLMTEPERQMHLDLNMAIQDSEFFEDGDCIIDLDGSEMTVHSTLLCQRCPFFEGLFNGRAAGQWLAGRRQDNQRSIRIDLKHIEPETFQLVLRYLYADIGSELFDEVVSSDIDELSEFVMDVLGVANELMLDRLSQICQEVIGRFVTTRNISQLLNIISSCSVAEFKDAGLEYICLQLECMLENHLLNDLDEHLLFELDGVVRGNQLNCLPFAKSGRAELLLLNHHPSLAGEIEEERERRIRDMAFRETLKDDDIRLSSSYRARTGSLDDIMSSSPSQDRARRKSKASRNAPFSPNIRPKDFTVDLMFDMDDDDTPMPKMWSSPVLAPTKLGMKDIMAQASSSRTSNLSISLSAQKAKEVASAKMPTQKLSQKERKKQQQQAAAQYQIAKTEADVKSSSPWQLTTKGTKTSLKDVLSESKPSPSISSAQPLNPPSSSRPLISRRTASPDTRFSGQARAINGSTSREQPSSSPNPSWSVSQLPLKSSPVIPHSKSYLSPTPKAEPSLQLSMADIIGQQKREQEVIKEAVAKRSLQEIQEEQAFQEWWDQESRRAQEEEASRAKGPASGASKNSKVGGGSAKGGTRGSRGRETGAQPSAQTTRTRM
ncbi:hypothetical protein OIDMADRAFT_103913 [Oidiodendron maius Zn]|uniref:BTB domain-containing protein n=1 Tax=Oidiodendron maius (strain Zn) TaxID=913774 RepID=A0A0C3HDK5_OIDMZ|nr:hypothetical protein OIDMADRAFT_103913 [Oidiodendron maius Zn]